MSKSLPIKVQQHPKHRDELHLMLFVFLLQELKEHILEIDVVHRPRRLAIGSVNECR